jgi:hypothetical protein
MSKEKTCPKKAGMMALSGNLWVPHWTQRPGSYTALIPVADCMPLWGAIHTWTGDYFKPCLYGEKEIGLAIGWQRGRVRRHTERLEKAALLFCLKRGKKMGSNELRPLARWALDPFTIERWRPKVEETFADMAEECGLGTRWYRNAITSLDAFERRSWSMMAKVRDDMVAPPLPKRKRRRKPKRGGCTTVVQE